MKQPLKGKKKKDKPVKIKSNKPLLRKKYGTSKLEKYFASEFLDRLKLKYIYQFEAKDIFRFYDFAVTVYDNYPYKYEVKEGINSIIQEGKEVTVGFLIEVDGDFYHSNPNKFDKDDLNPMQKHNKFVDRIKNDWAKSHGIPLLRIWEDDIRNNSGKVLRDIKKFVENAKKRRLIVENKRRPH